MNTKVSMAAASSTSVTGSPAIVSNQKALNDLLDNLRCAQCINFPANAHICPKCSEMFCYTCIRDWLRSTEDRCANCNAKIRPQELIKLRCFENLDSSNFGKAGLNVINNNLPEAGQEMTDSEEEDEDDDDDGEGEWIEIETGRQEPVANLPKAVEGTFTLRNFHRCKMPWICSERVVDEMGFNWRLRVAPKKHHGDARVVAVWVELLSGEEGFYEIMLELLNIAPRAFICKTFVVNDYYVGPEAFLAVRELPSGNFDLKFRYTIRPADFHAKMQIQQCLLDKRTKRFQQMKGESFTFTYRIHTEDLNDVNFRSYTDHMDNKWIFGVHKAHSYAEFQMYLSEGFSGIYDVQMTMTHSVEDYEKLLHYEREFLVDKKHLFNFQVRWDQLKEHGFTHGYENYVEIRVKICPIQLDMKIIQDYIDDEEDTSSSD